MPTPIAMEQHPEFLLPDANERNAILQTYAEAVGEVAAEKQIGLLDLFSPTREWFRKREQAAHDQRSFICPRMDIGSWLRS